MWTATGRNTHVLGRRTAVGPNGSFGKFNMFGAISGRDRSSVPTQFRPGPIFRSFKRRQALAPTAAARATELLTASALSTCGRDISSTQHLRRFWVISGVSHCQCDWATGLRADSVAMLVDGCSAASAFEVLSGCSILQRASL